MPTTTNIGPCECCESGPPVDRACTYCKGPPSDAPSAIRVTIPPLNVSSLGMAAYPNLVGQVEVEYDTQCSIAGPPSWGQGMAGTYTLAKDEAGGACFYRVDPELRFPQAFGDAHDFPEQQGVYNGSPYDKPASSTRAMEYVDLVLQSITARFSVGGAADAGIAISINWALDFYQITDPDCTTNDSAFGYAGLGGGTRPNATVNRAVYDGLISLGPRPDCDFPPNLFDPCLNQSAIDQWDADLSAFRNSTCPSPLTFSWSPEYSGDLSSLPMTSNGNGSAPGVLSGCTSPVPAGSRYFAFSGFSGANCILLESLGPQLTSRVLAAVLVYWTPEATAQAWLEGITAEAID